MPGHLSLEFLCWTLPYHALFWQLVFRIERILTDILQGRTRRVLRLTPVFRHRVYLLLLLPALYTPAAAFAAWNLRGRGYPVPDIAPAPILNIFAFWVVPLAANIWILVLRGDRLNRRYVRAGTPALRCLPDYRLLIPVIAIGCCIGAGGFGIMFGPDEPPVWALGLLFGCVTPALLAPLVPAFRVPVPGKGFRSEENTPLHAMIMNLGRLSGNTPSELNIMPRPKTGSRPHYHMLAERLDIWETGWRVAAPTIPIELTRAVSASDLCAVMAGKFVQEEWQSGRTDERKGIGKFPAWLVASSGAPATIFSWIFVALLMFLVFHVLVMFATMPRFRPGLLLVILLAVGLMAARIVKSVRLTRRCRSARMIFESAELWRRADPGEKRSDADYVLALARVRRVLNPGMTAPAASNIFLGSETIDEWIESLPADQGERMRDAVRAEIAATDVLIPRMTQ